DRTSDLSPALLLVRGGQSADLSLALPLARGGNGSSYRTLRGGRCQGSSWTLPPAAVIFCLALSEKAWACTWSAFLSSPRASTLTRWVFLISPSSRSASGVTWAFASKRSASVSRFTTSNGIRKILVNPRTCG